MDLLSVAISETSTLTVRHPSTGVDTDITIELYGSDTIAYKKAVGIITKRNNKRKNIPIEEIENLSIELLASITVGWKNLKEGAKTVPFNKDNAVRIYSSIPWLRKQIDAFIGDEQNFLQEVENN